MKYKCVIFSTFIVASLGGFLLTINNCTQRVSNSPTIIDEHTIGGFTIPAYKIPAKDRDLTSLRNTDLTFPTHNGGKKNTMANFLGVNHIWPGYALAEPDCLNDGGARMLELENVLKVVQEKKFAHVYWWELYNTPEAKGRRESSNPDDYPGYWLVAPDGKYTAVWNIFYIAINCVYSQVQQ